MISFKISYYFIGIIEDSNFSCLIFTLDSTKQLTYDLQDIIFLNPYKFLKYTLHQPRT